MKRIIGTVITAVLAATVGFTPTTASAAVPSNVVTSSEFQKVSQGDPIGHVRSAFGTRGEVVERINPAGTSQDYVRVEFPTYYDDGIVIAEFKRRASGTWYLLTKYAIWGNDARRTANKATESEFFKVKPGSSLAHARNTFDTKGTIVERFDAPGTKYDSLVVEWPTASTEGWVQMLFKKGSSGWKVNTRAAYWDVPPKRTANKATSSEFFDVKIGHSIDHARSTFDTKGTINYYFDAPGTADDAVWLLWSTKASDGFVEVDFVKRRTGTWKVDGRWAYWALPAKPTEDLATRSEFDALKGELDSGYTVPLADVRNRFGSSGTIVYYGDQRGTASDLLEVAWHTGSETEDVFAVFEKPVSSEWAMVSTDDLWRPWPAGSEAPSARMSAESQEAPASQDAMVTAIPSRPSWNLRDAG